MTDFEKYPKYHLDTHGITVQKILNTAEDVFGMAIDSQETPVIQREVGGGQNIVNDKNRHALFCLRFLPCLKSLSILA